MNLRSFENMALIGQKVTKSDDLRSLQIKSFQSVKNCEQEQIEFHIYLDHWLSVLLDMWNEMEVAKK